MSKHRLQRMIGDLFVRCGSWLGSWWVVACMAGGLHAAAAPDIASVPADLSVPDLANGPPSAGKRVRFELFPDSPPVVLYLPTDWTPEKQFPVIFELPGNGNFKNAFGDTGSGLPEGSRLGYGLSGGEGFIWVCLPFLNEAGNAVAITWWGDAPRHRGESTVAFIKRAVPAVCERFSGDEDHVILCGFSRGAIAVNAIGLHDDAIAGLWCGLVCYSHYDGVHGGWPFEGADETAARQRLARLKGRPQLICHESDAEGFNLEATRRYLAATKIPGEFTFVDTGFRNHNDAWVLRPSVARQAAREWLRRVIGAEGRGRGAG